MNSTKRAGFYSGSPQSVAKLIPTAMYPLPPLSVVATGRVSRKNTTPFGSGSVLTLPQAKLPWLLLQQHVPTE